MKKTLGFLLVTVLSATPALATSLKMSCVDKIDVAERELRRAKLTLEEKKWSEQNYAELAEDAKSNSKQSIALFTASSAVLAGGLWYIAIAGIGGIGSSSATVAPVVSKVFQALIGTSRTSGLIVLNTPVAMTVAGLGSAAVSRFILDRQEQEEELGIDELLGKKEFARAEMTIDVARKMVNLDYSQLTDFLGMRDRATTQKLYELATLSRQVAEQKVKHLEVVFDAVAAACQ